VDADGKVEGAPLEAARAALEPFYKSDEIDAWDLWFTREKRDGKRVGVLVVYFAAGRGRQAVWMALDSTGQISNDPKSLPSGAFRAMWKAAAN
jgi:hypothetical protein